MQRRSLTGHTDMGRKFKVNDLVIYEGLIGKVESLSEVYDGTPTVDLVSIEDEELTCTAVESKCELYNGEDFDQTEGLSNAREASNRITNMVGNITDKYFRDGNH